MTFVGRLGRLFRPHSSRVLAPYLAGRDALRLGGRCASSCVSNPHLVGMAGDDYLYHVGLNPAVDDLRGAFGDVRFVCIGGSVPRMTQFADRTARELLPSSPAPRADAVGKTERYSLFKAGPVLISSHGMGAPSVSILLHELAKLLHYAGATDAVWLRMGTSGGLGVEPGTLVVSQDAVDGLLDGDGWPTGWMSR